MPPWIRDAVPFRDTKPWKCKRYKSSENASINNNIACATAFSLHQVQNCEELVFATDEVTIVKEVCIF